MSESEPATRCRDCGLLGIRPRDKIEELHSYHVVGHKDWGKYRQSPLCAVGNSDFRGDNIDAVWQCHDFIQYQPGLTPREHIAMGILADFRAMSKQQEEWRKKCSDDDQKWREDQSAKVDKARLDAIAETKRLHEESMNEAKRMHWRELSILGGIVTFVMFAAAIIAVFIERNSLFPDPALSPPATVEQTSDPPAIDPAVEIPNVADPPDEQPVDKQADPPEIFAPQL